VACSSMNFGFYLTTHRQSSFYVTLTLLFYSKCDKC